MTKQVVVASDFDAGEAIYVDGRRVFEETRVRACDIGDVATGPIHFRHVNVELPRPIVDGFPGTLDELRQFVCPAEPPLDSDRAGKAPEAKCSFCDGNGFWSHPFAYRRRFACPACQGSGSCVAGPSDTGRLN